MDQLGAVKLTDFGLARLLRDDSDACSKASVNSEDMSLRQRSRAYSRVGSDYYAAPEVHMGLGYDTPVDIYSLGVTLYVMLCGTPPSSTSFFKSEDADLSDEDSSCMASISDVSSQSISELFPPELKVSPLAQDLVTKMIHPDPEKRIVASEALKHEWIIKHSIEEETNKVTHVTSKLSLSSSSNSLAMPRTLSFAETESFLRIGPALPVIPPSNSPTLRLTKVLHAGQTPEACTTPTSPTPSAAVTITLADVCNKLVPLVDEQRLHKQLKHRHRSHSHAEKVCFLSSRKHSRSSFGSSGGERQSKKKRISSKKVCIDLELHQDLKLHSASCVHNSRIGHRFGSSIPVFGPPLQQQSRSPA